MLNVKFFALLVVAVLLAAVVGLLVHNVQVERSAHKMLVNAQQAVDGRHRYRPALLPLLCGKRPGGHRDLVAYALLLAEKGQGSRRVLIEARACLEEASNGAGQPGSSCGRRPTSRWKSGVCHRGRLLVATGQAPPDDAVMQYNLGRALDGAGQYKRRPRPWPKRWSAIPATSPLSPS